MPSMSPELVEVLKEELKSWGADIWESKETLSQEDIDAIASMLRKTLKDKKFWKEISRKEVKRMLANRRLSIQQIDANIVYKKLEDL